MTNALTRRQTLQALGISMLPMPLIAAAQAAFPNKSVRIIVPLPASGAADVSVRILTEFMQQPLGQSLVVENRPGGIYQIGMQAITSAPADGHTLIHLNATMCAVQASLKRFDMLKQLIPVGYMGSTDAMQGVRDIEHDLPHALLWFRYTNRRSCGDHDRCRWYFRHHRTERQVRSGSLFRRL